MGKQRMEVHSLLPAPPRGLWLRVGEGSPPMNEHGGARRDHTQSWDWESKHLNPVTTTSKQVASASDLSSLCLSGSILRAHNERSAPQRAWDELGAGK